MFKNKMNRVVDVAWSSDGNLIAIAVAAYVDRGKVQPGLKVWDAATGKEVPVVMISIRSRGRALIAEPVT